MHYVIINGKNSNAYDGLQVLTLPPIVKPKMRTQVATIDGRPGDIVTRLGYEAYNKKIKVLLHDRYDLDAIESFFNSSGEVVFSNEPERVYQFETLDVIEFQRAAKFKTAEIVFHVQPYKHQYQEQPQTFSTSPAGVYNYGNTEAAPRITIAGSGTVTVSLDGYLALTITMPSAGEITIDSAELNAYSQGNLANRSVSGDYNDIKLSPGLHSLTWTGTVTSVTVRNISRWI